MNHRKCEHEKTTMATEKKIVFMDGVTMRNYTCNVCSGTFTTVERTMTSLRELEEEQRLVVGALQEEIHNTWVLTEQLAKRMHDEYEKEEVKTDHAEEA